MKANGTFWMVAFEGYGSGEGQMVTSDYMYYAYHNAQDRYRVLRTVIKDPEL